MESDPNFVVHLDMDTFFVSVERLHNPRLLGKPVLIGGSSDRGVVAACSYEARLFGVHSAMPMKKARILCPEAILVRGDHDAYSQKSHEVSAIIAEYVPDYEKASIDEHYLDLTGYDRYFGAYETARRIRQAIKHESGLPVSMGVSENKTVSKMAAKTAKPDGERMVPGPEISRFLSPLSVRDLPGLGPKMQPKLAAMGIKTIGQLAALPRELMLNAYGKSGLSLWEKACGIDESPVLPFREQKSISKETTFNADTIDLKMIRRTLVHMAEFLGFELRRQGKLASVLSVKIRYANFDTHTKDCRLTFTTADHLLIEKALALLDKVYDRRMSIRLIGLKASGLVAGYQQLALFEDRAHIMLLYEQTDRLKHKYGEEVVMRAAGLDMRAERPLTPNLPAPAAGESPLFNAKRYQFFGHGKATGG